MTLRVRKGSIDDIDTVLDLFENARRFMRANGNLTQDTFFFTSAQFKLVKPVVSAEVTKVWDDADNQDGLRSDSVTVELLANGKESAYDALELSEDTDWAGSWARLNRYENNQEVQYSVNEADVPDGYEFSMSSENLGAVVLFSSMGSASANAGA